VFREQTQKGILVGKMKGLLVFIVFYLALLLLGAATNAQWEDAQVQRLTFDSLPNKVIRLYVDDQDKLHLFYLEGVRDTASGFVYDCTIIYRTKEQGGSWSEPEEIRTPEYVSRCVRSCPVGAARRV
jgi:hypothetical protein